MTSIQVSDFGPDLLRAAEAQRGATTELRREIHRDPELGLDLPNTQARVLDALTGLDLAITTGTTSTSIVADLDTGRPGSTVLLRGDMDALPMTEDVESSFRSAHEGRSHSCGHDAHTAMLVSAAAILSERRSELSGRVRFMFQPGEEGFHGAKHMIAEGVLDGVDRAFAIHVVTNAPSGIVLTRGGALLASSDGFEITVTGRGGHASSPHHCLDPIPTAASIVTGLQTMVSRQIDPSQSAVVTVANITAGSTGNVIPETAYMQGTIRAVSEEVRADLHAAIERVADGTAAAHACSCETTIKPGYSVTLNDPVHAQLTTKVAGALFGSDQSAVMPATAMGAEDFSYVLNEVPGAMAFLGACPDGIDPAVAAPNHSNHMQLNEAALERGTALYAAMALVRPEEPRE